MEGFCTFNPEGFNYAQLIARDEEGQWRLLRAFTIPVLPMNYGALEDPWSVHIISLPRSSRFVMAVLNIDGP